jgi:hypothetical protein
LIDLYDYLRSEYGYGVEEAGDAADIYEKTGSNIDAAFVMVANEIGNDGLWCNEMLDAIDAWEEIRREHGKQDRLRSNCGDIFGDHCGNSYSATATVL